MKEILLINPSRAPKKRRGTKKNRENKMAAKKKTKKRGTAIQKRAGSATKKRSYSKKTVKSKRRRRNPQSPKKAALNLLNWKSMLGMAGDATKQLGGKLACQFTAKRFADGGGANENWGWKNYLLGLAGTAVSAFGAEMIKRGSGREFMTGGLSYMMLKAVVGELGPRCPWIETYFGAPEDYGYGTGVSGSLPGQYLGTDGVYRSPGEVYYGDDGEVYLLGADGVWRPTTDDYRNPELLGMGDGFSPRGELGDAVVPVGPLGMDPYQNYFNRMGDGDPYAQTFFRA